MMMKWEKERDSLIAQTRAFVNSVIAWKADVTPQPAPAKPVAIENTFAVRLREELDQLEIILPSQPAIAASETEAPSTHAMPTAELPVREPPSLTPSVADFRREKEAPAEAEVAPNDIRKEIDVRKEIQNRVAAFQAHQHRFAREREAYFKSVLTKARSSLDRDGDDGNHDEPSA
jgi:hypothetical protein